ncbi:hypothetical protein ACHQM5_027317 [Ranunculus cassubicifolius]
MRIHPSSSNTSSSSSSYSSDSTSLTPSNTISFTSSSSNSSSTSIDSMTRCEGLDLLVKAVVHVAGSLLVVPFTQRRVIRRRKRALRFTTFEFIKKEQEEEEEDYDDKDEDFEVNLKGNNKRKREKGLPLKYNDSVLQPWKKRSSRRPRSTMKMNRSMG